MWQNEAKRIYDNNNRRYQETVTASVNTGVLAVVDVIIILRLSLTIIGLERQSAVCSHPNKSWDLVHKDCQDHKHI